ncbi:MAG: hypothetical protein ACFUZC_04165 [Chthoniobacteraceae bacterium]
MKTNQNRLFIHRPLAAFSLVEVVLALGICSFCLISVLGLLPVGINTNRDSIEQTAAVGIARAVGADFWGVSATATATSLYGILLPTSTAATTTPAQTLFFAENGNTTDSVSAARYRVDVAYGARSNASQPAAVRILVSWPATANPAKGQWPTNQAGSYQVVTVLNIL